MEPTCKAAHQLGPRHSALRTASRLHQAASDLDALHAIFVPVGGGGLIAGIAAYVKALKPGIKVIGVEPTGAALCACRWWRCYHVNKC